MNRIRKEPEYAEGKLPFNREKHIIDPIEFDEEDVKHMETLFPNKQVYLIFPPIPNIMENKVFVTKCNKLSSQFKNTLNTPITLDSNLFFDQWYHMNGIGSSEETARMSKYLSSLKQ